MYKFRAIESLLVQSDESAISNHWFHPGSKHSLPDIC